MKKLLIICSVLCLILVTGCANYYKELAEIAFCSGYHHAVVAYRNGDITDDMDEDKIAAYAIVKFNELMNK